MTGGELSGSPKGDIGFPRWTDCSDLTWKFNQLARNYNQTSAAFCDFNC